MAGIFHFVSALSVQDFAHAVESALPGARSEHEQGQFLILDRADLALQRHGWCLSLAQHGQSATTARLSAIYARAHPKSRPIHGRALKLGQRSP